MLTEFLAKHFIKDYQDVQNPKVRERYGVLGGIVGICCNVLLSTAKLIAGVLTGAISITADALNNLSDAGSSVVTLCGFKMASKPADAKHPFGHGRIEYVSGLIVSMVILLMGFELIISSVEKIAQGESVSFSVLSLVILLFSIVVKLWMAFFNRGLGKRIDSAAMKATAMDSLSDVIATTAVVIGLLVFQFTGVSIDGYIGVVVACFIMYTGYTTAKDTLSPLLGQAPDPAFVQSIEKKVLAHPDIVGVHDLIVHNYGPGRSVVSLHAEVPCHIDILKIHDTIDNIEREIKAQFHCECVIHMDPIVTDDKTVNDMHEKIAKLVQNIDERMTIHDFRMVAGPTHTNLIFDVVVPHGFRLSDEEVVEQIRYEVLKLGEQYQVVIDVDKCYVTDEE